MSSITRESLFRLGRDLEVVRGSCAESRTHDAPDFSAFDAFRPLETGLSRVIAYLLDPAETHGQGDLLLNQFLSWTGWAPVGNRHVRVTTEAVTSEGRRIDIVIEVGSSVLGIENKPWAGESEAQCEDYLRYLTKRYPGRDCVLVFLTSDGRASCTAGPFASQVVPMSWRQLLRFEAKAPRVQAFLAEFFRYIQGSILGEPQMTSSHQAELDLLLQEGNVDLTLEVLSLAPSLRRRIIGNFGNLLLNQLRLQTDGDWAAPYLKDLWESKYGCLAFYRPLWQERFSICFSNQRERGAAVGFGVWCWDRSAAQYAELVTPLRQQLDSLLDVKGRDTPTWLWFAPLASSGLRQYDNWHDSRALKRIASGQALEELGPVVQRTAAILDSLL